MSAVTKVILLERVEKLGTLGQVVSVKPGFARNYLLPQKKALRANKENIAYFEAQKKHLEDDNNKKKAEAEKLAKKLNGLTAPLIRQASEAGHLFGSVNARDIADSVSEVSGEAVLRTMVKLDQNIKTIALLPIKITLHPEVSVEVTINIARSKEEAKIQDETGRALISTNYEEPEVVAAPVEKEEAQVEDADDAETTEDAA